ncbi:hypothetical protein DL93DRAFT_1599778 [Clavulina sp. PMI_390]|nr:hypothetical protein DL93DRAFT_1599778 [Clavulina sp. PMI_390]
MSDGAWNAPRIPSSPAIVSSSSLPTSPVPGGLVRRLSWNRETPAAVVMDDPLSNPSGHYSASHRHSEFENPFDDDEEEAVRAGRGAYNLQQPSQTSLVADFQRDTMHQDFADDEQRLTSAAQPFWGGVGSDAPYADEDDERRAGNAIKGRRNRYVGSTPTRSGTLGGSALRAMSRNFKRMSLRVVDIASSSTTREHGVRLDDEDDEDLNEKTPHPENAETPHPESPPSRLRGTTLGIFGPHSGVRLALLNFLVAPWTEPLILLLIFIHAIVLIIESSRSVYLHQRPVLYFHQWEDFVIFGLFVIYTLEMFARILTTGLVLDPEVPWRSIRLSFRAFVTERKPILRAQFRDDPLDRPVAVSALAASSSRTVGSGNPSSPLSDSSAHQRGDSFWRLAMEGSAPTQYQPPQSEKKGRLEAPFQLAIEKQRSLSEQGRPYLRHSWNRIDFVSIVSFWIMFILAILRVEDRPTLHLFIFRALSVLRISRLLAVTGGTATIMRSLKKAGPLLVRVAIFILFAIVLFSIIGVQSFKNSYRRSCQLLNSDGTNMLDSSGISNPQVCGGHINATTLHLQGFIQTNGVSTVYSKGYVCSLGQVCMDTGSNPNGGLESFDNIVFSVLQVVILAGVNGWSPVMYQMMDAEFFISCLFFIAGAIVLNIWLLNLFVAVITNTFSAIREETKKSAFGAAKLGKNFDDQEDATDGPRRRGVGWIQKSYNYTKWLWVVLALTSLGFQASRTSSSSQSHINLMKIVELYITLAFAVEIIWRILADLPDWREFFSHRHNLLDLALVIITTTIQIPAISNSGIYAWLTIFQLMRFYRVILFVPRMRPLLLQVFGNLGGLINMTLFLLLTNLIGGLIAMQLFRGDLSATSDEMTFYQTFNAFLAMYQIFSSENWTTVLYNVGSSEIPFGQAALGLIFISVWFLFANFIMLQMYIAVINENFEVAEEQKRSQQVKVWVERAATTTSGAVNLLDIINPYRYMKADPRSVTVEALPSNLILPLQKAIVQDGRSGRVNRNASLRRRRNDSENFRARPQQSGIARTLENFFEFRQARDDIPLTTLRNPRPESIVAQDPYLMDDMDRHLEALANVNNDHYQDDIHDQIAEDLHTRAEFINAHPTYDRSLWVLSQKNPLRRFCQTLVMPSNGDRINGTPPTFVGQACFELIILIAVIGGMIVAAIANPVYRADYVKKHNNPQFPWYDVAETAFGLTLLVEFIIKIIADGFMFTPNAYLYSIWNVIDFIILVSLLVNLAAALIVIGELNRLLRSLKALRALRLITIFGWMRSTFHSVLFAGASRILDAAVLAMLYMIPYAVWGLNLFNGLFYTCNDGGSNIFGKSDCINEFISTPLDGQNLGFLAPRSWRNPQSGTQWSFDSFSASLLILFEIVSLEGWINVLGAAMAITSIDQQPNQDATQANAIFFLAYNLLGAVVILTLFVSIIIGNFSSRSGMALLTTEQRQWIDLQKLLKRQRPSRRPASRPSGWRGWCYDRAVHKHGWWSRAMTVVYCLHILNLTTETFYTGDTSDPIQDAFFLLLSFVYGVDVIVRLVGLGRAYWRGGWNIFDIIVCLGTFSTTIAILLGSTSFMTAQLQKLFLVSIAFKLVQKFNNLNQLFKTAVASLPVIVKLFSLWIVMFLLFAIADMEVFGLTRWNSSETYNQNFRSLDKALVMLAFMSTGEGWNGYMHDYATSYPYCTSTPTGTDCGSIGWAYGLFIAWNVVSMYIFLNMFTGVVVENFSYVFQLQGPASLTREEMRSFKKIWAEFDPTRKGYIPRAKFVAFFARLSGVFEVRIYPREAEVRKILEKSREIDPDPHQPRLSMYDVDVNRLQRVINSIDFSQARQRRALYNRLFQEALIIQEPGRGLSFTNMLLLLAHYKIIDDENALRVDEVLRRRSTKSYISDRVNVDRVRSMLRMIYHRRKFLAWREEQARKRMAESSGIAVPEIIVDDRPATPPSAAPSTRDITLAGRNSVYLQDTPERPRIQIETSTEHGHRQSIMSSRSADLGSWSARSRESSPSRASVRYSAVDQQAVLNSLNNSMWQDVFADAAEEAD